MWTTGKIPRTTGAPIRWKRSPDRHPNSRRTGASACPRVEPEIGNPIEVPEFAGHQHEIVLELGTGDHQIEIGDQHPLPAKLSAQPREALDRNLGDRGRVPSSRA